MLFDVFRGGYGGSQLLNDITAGAIVGIVALPLAIAFGIASGVTPDQGLITAVVAGLIISLLGGSRVQIGGPTGAFIVIVYGIVQQHGYQGLVIATIMAGFLLILFGLTGMGAIIQYVPYPVTVGFTSGIAVVIATTQLPDFLGLSTGPVPSDFLGKLTSYYGHIQTVNLWALLIGVSTITIVIFSPKFARKVPGSLVAILLWTIAAHIFNLPIETIGSRFGEVSASIPTPSLPSIDIATIKSLLSPALAIALLGAIESLLSAVVSDGMTGYRHKPDAELVAQGLANIGSALFGGIPATGAIARTATNVKNGGRTPVAGVVHALVLLAIMILFGGWAALIPIPVLSGILLVVAYNMSEWRLFARLLKSPRSDVLVLAVTFILTVLVDLTVALEVGVVLAAMLFMRRMAAVSNAGFITKSILNGGANDPGSITNREIPQGVEIFEVYGPFFFGAASKFRDAISVIKSPPRVLILRMREVTAMDATGIRALEDVAKKSRMEGTILILSGVHAQPLVALEHSGLLLEIGEDNVFAEFEGALARARELAQ
ncbi:MAG: sodium-independent anion transporter [Deltaproteobacteria bacterium]|nr:MAG: sodium-independent anion transporter [Deltaproteobacteria bacterium]